MKASIGQDSHRFDLQEKEKPFILGGIVFENMPALAANSDGRRRLSRDYERNFRYYLPEYPGKSGG